MIKPRKIQTTIALAFGTLVLGTALVMALVSFRFTQEAVQRSSREYTSELIVQVRANIDSYVTHMKNIAEVVQVNEQVQSYFGRRPELSPLEQARAEGFITGFLNSVSRTREDISLIMIVGEDGRVFTNNPELDLNESVEISEKSFYQNALARSGEAVISSSHVQNLIEGIYTWVITLSRTINDPVTGETHGVLLVDLNFSVINDMLSRISLGPRGYMFIVDPEGGIVYHPRQALIYSGLEREYIEEVLANRSGLFEIDDDRGARAYTVTVSESTGWRIVGVNYSEELVRNRGEIRRSYLIGAVLFVFVSVLVAVWISHRLSRPILDLRGSMKAVERGDFDISVDVSANNEIGDLARDFNIMIAQIKDLMRRNEEEHEEKRKSELLALQNQITPHFLYNTLDTIVWMAEGKQYENVVETVAALARLLRLSVNKGEELISVRDEIDHIRSYLTIQKLRYQDRLDFMIGVDPDILALETPKVILQPLVENAIYHGIKNKEAGGRVVVRGARVNGSVLLEVEDDGLGMDEVLMAGVTHLHAESDRGTNGGSRVGVRNVHERIQLYFGPEYGLRYRRNAQGGTTVEVKLPVVNHNGSNHE
ncbi:MAG: sensor histidine kinase [Spirochaetales bacterium]